MKNERVLILVGTICLLLMIAAVVIVSLRYMHEEPFWNATAVTEAPTLEIVTENLPPG